MPFNKLVLSGGSMKGLAYVGFLEYLEENKLVLDILDEIVGTSIGALSALVIILGYTSADLKEIFINFDFENLKDFKVSSLVSNYGLDDGTRMDAMIKVFIKNKKFDENVTLKQLFKKTKKSLVTVATNVNSRETVFFNKEKYPDLPVYLAVRMSLNIPFIFSPVLYNGHYYADGGLTCNFPAKYYSVNGVSVNGVSVNGVSVNGSSVNGRSRESDTDAKVLCVSLSDHDPNNPDVITHFDGYLYSVMRSAFYSIECSDKNFARNNGYSIIYIKINGVSSLDFSLPRDKRELMYIEGYQSAKEFFSTRED
jgi:predicted acylesterase/phospholipase RssA